jgi:hypothetical protein
MIVGFSNLLHKSNRPFLNSVDGVDLLLSLFNSKPGNLRDSIFYPFLMALFFCAWWSHGVCGGAVIFIVIL